LRTRLRGKIAEFTGIGIAAIRWGSVYRHAGFTGTGAFDVRWNSAR
jgi:hypothetical protein